MKILEVIESKRWVNKITGETASIYGSVPYANEIEKKNWVIETKGFTWKLDNGTIGLGRSPVKTKEEAIEIMQRINNL